MRTSSPTAKASNDPSADNDGTNLHGGDSLREKGFDHKDSPLGMFHSEW